MAAAACPAGLSFTFSPAAAAAAGLVAAGLATTALATMQPATATATATAFATAANPALAITTLPRLTGTLPRLRQ